MPDCTCTFGPERHEHAVINGGGHRYAVYLDDFDQDVTWDSACPFHGDNGSMVAVVALNQEDRRG